MTARITESQAKRLGLVKRGERVKSGRDWEAELLGQIRAAGLPEPMRQVRVIPNRKFVWDFGWVLYDGLHPTKLPKCVLVEVQGGIYSRGKSGHISSSGVSRDYEKSNLAQLAGHISLSVTSDMIKNGTALKLIEQALGLQQ